MKLKSSLFVTAMLMAAALFPQHLLAQAVTVTATKDDGVPAATHVPAGTTVIYTNTVKNTGAVNATGVEFRDPDVAHTSYVAGSLTATPVARDDTYSTPILANTSVDTSISSGFNVLTNDFCGYVGGVALASSSAAVTVAVGTQAAHGTVVFNTGAAKGTFVYTPTAGYTGGDSFTYTVSNGISGGTAASITGTVNLTVAASPVIWFVNANAGSNGTGTLGSPFNSLAAFQAVNDGVGLHPAAGHQIYLYESGTAYTGGVTLLANQKLIGQDSTSAFATLTGASAPADTTGTFPVSSPFNGTFVTLTTTSGTAVSLNSGNTLNGFTVGNTGITGIDIGGGAVGSLTVADVSCTGTGAIMSITTSGALNVALNNASSTNSVNAINLVSTSGTFTANSGAISGTTGDCVVINGGTANITYPGTISGGLSGHSVNVSNKTGGTVLFSGAISEIGTGITLTTNTGATINFTGGLSISSAGSNNGFVATGGGTINVTQDNTSIINTISSNGYALNVSNTAIGASGITFRSITSSAGSGNANGIILDTTGSTGSLTVTGLGTTAGSGGTISGKTGTDGSSTNGIGVYLNNTSSPSLSYMSIQGCQNHGIRGNSVTNLNLTSCTIGNTTTNGTSNTADIDAASYQGEGSVRFFNLLGTATVTGCTFDKGFSKTFAVVNNTGTLTNLTFSGCTINNSLGTTTSSDALFLQTTGSSTTATLTVTSATQFSSFYQNAIDLNAQGGSTLNFNMDGSTIKNTLVAPVGSSNAMVINGSGTNTFVTFNIHDNTFTQGNGAASPPANVGRLLTAGSVSGACTFYGKLVNNTFGTSGVARSGGGNGADSVGLFMNGTNGSHGGSRYLVQGNTMQNYGQTGLQIGATGGSATIDATVIGNTMRQPGPAAQGAFAGIWAYVAASGTDTNVLNIQIGDKNTTANKNTLTGSDPSNFDDIFFGSSATSSAVINLSKAGSSSSTAQNVVTDDNVFGTDTGTYGDDGFTTINLVAGSPLSPPLLFAPGGIERAASVETAVAAATATLPVPAPVSAAATRLPAESEKSVGPQPAATPGVLSQSELDAVVASALARWEATGLTSEQSARLRRMNFEATTLATDRLGEAGPDTIRVDARAGGNGWFTDASTQSDALFGHSKSATRSYTDAASAPAGHIDLLTTILHEMGHALGLSDTYRLQDRDSVMYGYLTKGERRLPAKNQAKGAVPFADNATHFLTNTPVDAMNNPTGIDNNINPVTIGTLPAGKSVIITYSVTVENPIVGATQLSSQATVHSSTANFTDVTSTDVAGGVATGSGPTLTTLAVPPTVTSSTVALAQNAPGIIITGTFFDTTASNNTVAFSNGAVGTVTAATSTQLTVAFSTTPTSIGPMTAVVTTLDGNSGAGVQVATVVPAPVITSSTTSLGINSSTVTINGSNFSATAGNNTVVFNDGAVGTVTAATTTQLTVTLSSQPTAVGNLTANVTAFGGASGAVQVATVVPVVTTNTATIAANASSLSINGFGFSATAINNGVTYSGAGVGSGTVSASSATGLSASLPAGMIAGVLNASVTSNGFSSGTAVQVATVAPVVTSSTAALAANATTVTFTGVGFDPVAANNSVVFNDGAAGTVTSATNTSLTVTFSTTPATAGSLTAVVTTNSVSSGAAVQVATVTPVVTTNAATIQNTASTVVINGFGFSPTPASNFVQFNAAGAGTVTAATPTQLTVTFTTAPTVGDLYAIVTVAGQNSGSFTKVATVISLSITQSTANLVQSGSTLTIAGTGFSTTPSNNTVTFNNGAVGTVTAATATQLTVTFSTNATALGALNATVSVVGTGSTGPTQVATVVAGAPAKLAFIQQPSNALSGAAISPAITVQIQDANGFLTTDTSNVTMAFGNNPGSATLSGTTTVAAVAGTATFNTLNIDKAGSGYTLSASSGVLTGATSSAFNISPGAPAKLAVGTQPTNAVSATAISPAVTVRILDAAGNLTTSTANVTMAIGTNPASGTLSGTTTVGAVSGIATFSTLNIDKAGTGYTLSATSGVLTSATSSAFNITAGVPAKLAVTTQPTNAVSATAISPAVIVQIQDAAGNLTTSTANVVMAIGTNPGSGTLSGTTTVAAVSGAATFSTLNIDKAGTGYTLSATSGVLTSATSNAFNITAGAPAKLAVTTQPTNTVSATAISPAVLVQIQDAAGNLTTSTANVVMAIGTNPSSGTLSGTTTVAAVSGTATFSTLKIDKAGTGYTLSATSGVLTSATSNAFNITAGAPAQLAVITQPSNTVSATAISPAVTVQIQDAAGNLTTSTANVVMAIGTNPGSGTLSGTATVAAVAGTATFSTLNIDKAGTGYTLSATSGVLTGATSSAFNITAGAPAKLAVGVQPTTTVAGVAISPAVTVQIQDAAGNLTTSTGNVTMAIGTNPASGTLSGTLTTAAVAGTATFSTLSIDKAGTGYTLAATSGVLTGATSSTFNITAAAPAKLAVITQPTDAVSATSISPAVTVQIQDSFGNATTSTANVSMAIGTNPGSGTLSGTTSVAAVAGTATFSTLKIDKAGSGYTLNATSGVLTGAISSTFKITAGAPAKLAIITQPTDAISAAAISPAVTVQIQDAAGNLTASTANVSFAIGTNPSSGTLSGTTTVAAVAGTATFSTLNIDKAGTGYTLAASSGVLTGATSSTFNITAGAPAKLAMGIQPTTTVAGVSISPAVTVKILDAAGNQTTSTGSVTMAIGTNPGSGTLSGSTTVSAVNGTASFNSLSINKVGTGYTLSASSAALTGSTSASFSITPAAASSLVVALPGTGAAGTPALGSVTAKDAFGNTATGYGGTVGFTSTDAAAGLPANSTLVNGVGAFNFTFANAGSQTVTATDTVTTSITGTSNPITITDTVVIAAVDNNAAVTGGDTGTYRFTRGGKGAPMTVNFTLDGASTASASEYSFSGGSVSYSAGTGTVVIPNGVLSVDLTLTASANSNGIAKPSKTVVLDVATSSAYTVGGSASDTVTITQNGFGVFTNNDSGEGTLRQAVLNANALAGDDVVVFDSMVFGAPATITLSSALSVTGNGKLAIVLPPTAVLTLSGGGVGRVLQTSGTADLTLSGVVITNGTTVLNGGGIFHNGGSLTVISSTIAGNFTSVGSGGGIYAASGTTTKVINSTIAANTSGGAGAAGGIDSAGTLTIINSTIYGNSVSTNNAANAGGIKQAGTATLTNVTIAGNGVSGSGTLGASGMQVVSGTVTVGNTLIAANSSNSTTPDIVGAFTSAGHNLIGNKGTATGFTNGTNGDQVGTGASVLNPNIGALGNNGGPTQTVLLLSGSPAINTGSNALLPVDTFDLDGDSNTAEVLPVDQRGVGFPRVQGSTADIGAIEGLIFTPSLTAATTNEDVQSSSGLVITANAADAGGTTNYQITAITGGTLFKSDGTTQISSNDFITKAEGTAGLKFTPAANAFSPSTTFGFSVQASISADASGLKDAAVAASITVNPVADTPSVTGTATTQNIQSVSGLVITLNAVDGAEVTRFKISNIQNGTLYQNNGTTAINAGDYITVPQGGAGLKFTPALNFTGVASFDVQGSIDGAGTGLSSVATASIAVGTVNPTPTQLVPTDPVTGLPLPAGSLYPTISQTGTLEVRVAIKNTTAFPLNGFRLSVDYTAYLPFHSLILYNRTSPSNKHETDTPPNIDYIDYPFPVAVGATVSLKLQFYTTTRTLPNQFSPTLTVTTLQASEVSTTDGSGVQPRINARPSGAVLLEWDSTPGLWYRVKYSSDLTNWFDSPVPIQAATNRTQWLDDGAPFTDSPPSTVPQRFYRVNQIAAPTL